MNESPPVALDGKTALVTGAARRIGAEICRTLHAQGMRIAIHYRGSADDAISLADDLNAARADSARTFQGDLIETGTASGLIEAVVGWAGELDVLVNNASTFYPTPLGEIDEAAWVDLTGSNLKAPLFLSQAAAPHLQAAVGSIVKVGPPLSCSGPSSGSPGAPRPNRAPDSSLTSASLGPCRSRACLR